MYPSIRMRPPSARMSCKTRSPIVASRAVAARSIISVIVFAPRCIGLERDDVDAHAAPREHDVGDFHRALGVSTHLHCRDGRFDAGAIGIERPLDWRPATDRMLFNAAVWAHDQ